MQFQRAERKKSFIKVAITGPSGSGKTYSALRLAFGLGRKVAFIDTENGSGSLYADLGEYDTLDLTAPFTVASYEQAIRGAVSAGYDVLIVDSLTHAWAGEGGLLAQKEALDARGGNSYTNWATITKQHEAFKSALLQAPIHILATMRSKQDYVLEADQRGKTTPRKVGLAPIQRDGMEYEFTTVFDVAMDHTAIASKDRTGLFDALSAKLTEDHGRAILRWLEGGAVSPEPAPAPSPAAHPPASVNGQAAAAERDRNGLLQRYGAAKGRAKALGGEVAKLDPNYTNEEIAAYLEVAEATVRELEERTQAAGAVQ